MSDEISFQLPGRGPAQSDPWARKPDWARVVGFGCAELSTTSPPATGPHWVVLEKAPIVGRTYPLKVWYPFRATLGDFVWVAYPPPAPEPAVWCDAPASLPQAGLARCRLLDVLSHDEPEQYYLPGAWLRVEIEEAIALPDLATRFAPDTAGLPFPAALAGEGVTSKEGCHCGDLHYLGGSAEGDVGEWAVWQRLPGGAAVVLVGEHLWHDDFIYAGHRPLSATELRELEARQAYAEHGPVRSPPPPPDVDVVTNESAAGSVPRRGWRLWERWRSRLFA